MDIWNNNSNNRDLIFKFDNTHTFLHLQSQVKTLRNVGGRDGSGGGQRDKKRIKITDEIILFPKKIV